MVIVKLWGGLGNQLFQYAFGQYLSSRLNTDVKYDIQTTNNIDHFTQREFGFPLLNIDIMVASAVEINSMRLTKIRLFGRLERKISQIVPFIFRHYFVEPVNSKSPDTIRFKDNCYYDGYWQSYKYLSYNENRLHNEIRLLSITPAIYDKLNSIRSTFSISIHVRRGDYITVKANADIFHTCSLAYYQQAIEYIRTRYVSAQFFVFSDDLNWVKENLEGNQLVLMEGNVPAVDLFLMSNCKHNIIANSSFSWWGGWLNQNIEKIVICPRDWYKGELNNTTVDLIPPQWIRI